MICRINGKNHKKMEVINIGKRKRSEEIVKTMRSYAR